METFTFHEGTIRNVHPPEKCEGEWCVIHKPLDTYDRSRLHWRSDRAIFEVICEHGVGHIAPEQVEYLIQTRGEGALTHGCCWERCCAEWNKEEA